MRPFSFNQLNEQRTIMNDGAILCLSREKLHKLPGLKVDGQFDAVGGKAR